MVNVSKFIKDHIPLCVCTLGLAVLGYLGYHAVRWIINKCHKTKKIDQVAQTTISINHSTNSQILFLQQSESQKTLAATKIQSVIRGHLALKEMQVRKLEGTKSAAAIKIQSVCRGHLSRIKIRRHVLSYELFEKAMPYVRNSFTALKNVPRAPRGNTPVYLPKELPIVLKISGSPKSQERFDQMREARDICEENEYKHLVIPKARVYGGFIIESRLPITMNGTKEQIGFYIENRKRFTDAVIEFTGLLCQSRLSDITGQCRDPYGTLSETPVGRYDNVALYLEEDQGKIGLIDLEQFSPGCSKYCFSKCRDAVHLFPYHLEDIMIAAKKFDSNIEDYRKDLEKERDEALKRFKIAYEDHLDFVIKKGITLENPIAFEKLGSIRLEELKEVIKTKLIKENDYIWFKGCLGEKPAETLICFNEKAFPKILDAVYKLINDLLEFNLKAHESPISSNPQLLSVRTLSFNSINFHIHNKVYDEFIDTVSKSIGMLIFENQYSISDFSNIMFEVIIEELEGKEIAYYNPYFGYGCYATKCIFC